MSSIRLALRELMQLPRASTCTLLHIVSRCEGDSFLESLLSLVVAEVVVVVIMIRLVLSLQELVVDQVLMYQTKYLL